MAQNLPQYTLVHCQNLKEKLRRMAPKAVGSAQEKKTFFEFFKKIVKKLTKLGLMIKKFFPDICLFILTG